MDKVFEEFSDIFIVGIAVKGGNTYGFTRCFRGS